MALKTKVKEEISFEKEYSRIAEINLLKGVTPAKGLCKLFEEAGELAQAVNVEIGIKNGLKKDIKPNVLEEAADAIQNILSIANLFDITAKELLQELNIKSTVWSKTKRKSDQKKVKHG